MFQTVAEPNAFAVGAAVAAFTRGGDWLDELRAYLYQNKKITSEFLLSELNEVKLVPSEATYLLWLDCSAFTDDSDKLARFIRENTGLYLSSGSVYGSNGKSFLRLNIACPRDRLTDGLKRLKSGIKKYIDRSL